MTRLGAIQRCIAVSSGLIISLRLTDSCTQAIRIGDTILIDGTTTTTVRGHKHWPEKNEIDLLVDSVAIEPGAGPSVYLV